MPSIRPSKVFRAPLYYEINTRLSITVNYTEKCFPNVPDLSQTSPYILNVISSVQHLFIFFLKSRPDTVVLSNGTMHQFRWFFYVSNVTFSSFNIKFDIWINTKVSIFYVKWSFDSFQRGWSWLILRPTIGFMP